MGVIGSRVLPVTATTPTSQRVATASAYVRRAGNALYRGGAVSTSRPSADEICDIVDNQAVSLLLSAQQDNSKTDDVEERKSELGGAGVFARRDIKPGRVVAFFPGALYLPIPDGLATLDNPVPAWYPEEGWDKNDKMLCRPDLVQINGKSFVQRNDPREVERDILECDAENAQLEDHSLTEEQIKYRDLSLRMHLHLRHVRNRFAVGHLLNHPPSSFSPNVMSWPIDLDVEHLRTYGIYRETIPYTLSRYWYYSTELGDHICTPMTSILPGVAMITTRHITAGSELLFDYQLKLKQLPPWYEPRDCEKDMEEEALDSN